MQKARGCFGTSEIEDDYVDLKCRPKETRTIPGIRRRENYIYKVEEINAAKKIATYWKQNKANRNSTRVMV